LLVLSLRAPKSKKEVIGTMADTNSPSHSNKNKQYVATNTMRRPSHCHCRSDNAGESVKNCIFIALIELIQRPFLFDYPTLQLGSADDDE
jgi:hypothetical protein